MSNLIPQEVIERKIYLIRGHRVMLDRDLARLYGVSSKRLNEQVKRNIMRFPDDFMFQLTWHEAQSLRSQFATLNNSSTETATVKSMRGRHAKYLPHVFTEQGVAMLSSVLNSEKAVKISIIIIKTFVKLREIMATHKDLAHKLDELERKIEKHDEDISSIFEAIRQLMAPPPAPPKRRIGFHA